MKRVRKSIVAARRPALPLTGVKGERAVENWNRIVAVGAHVDVTLDDGSVKETTTLSEAWMLGGHTAVVVIRGISGAYSLARVHMNGRSA